MAVTINASTTAGLVNTADTSGVLALQTAGTTAVTVNASQVVSIGTTNVGGTLNTTTTSGNWGVLIYDGTNNASMLQFRNNAGAAAGDISLSSAGATSLLISSVAGVNFPATQVASANANTLDDYEEGTWTATMVPSTSGTITLSNFNKDGTYTKIGRTVTINAALKVSSVSSPVGYFTIQGLPFSGGAGATFRCSISILGDAMETTMTTSITASMQSGTVLYVFKYNGTGSQANCAQDVKANSEFFIGGTYTID
jgi:hypothetical protein